MCDFECIDSSGIHLEMKMELASVGIVLHL